MIYVATCEKAREGVASPSVYHFTHRSYRITNAFEQLMVSRNAPSNFVLDNAETIAL